METTTYPPDPSRPAVICWTCGSPGHLRKFCPQQTSYNYSSQQFDRRPSVINSNYSSLPSGSHNYKRVYLTACLAGVRRKFMLDTGCEQTVFPIEYVRDIPLTRASQRLTSANETPIEVTGAIIADLTIGRLH